MLDLQITERLLDYNSLLVVGVALVVVILQILVRLIFPDFFKLILYRLFVENLSGRQLSKRVEVSALQILTLIKAVLVLSMMAFVAVNYLPSSQIEIQRGSEWLVLLIIIGICLCYCLIKPLINNILSNIFRIKAQIDYYNTLIFDTLRFLGILLLPIVVFVPFLEANIAKWLIILGIGIIVLLLVFQYITMFLYLFKNKFLNHYSFLYFCAVEILPILVMLKLVF